MKAIVCSMGNGHTANWPALKQLCAEYNSQDLDCLKADGIDQRLKQIDENEKVIQKRLDAMRLGETFIGWTALYEPMDAETKYVQPILSREAAQPYSEQVREHIEQAITYARNFLALHTYWEEANSVKLAYDIEHPREWVRLTVGTILQSLLSQQQEFRVTVLPRRYSQRGGLQRREGLTNRQAFQIGRTVEEAMEDIGGKGLLGGNADDQQGGYDLGIDPDFL